MSHTAGSQEVTRQRHKERQWHLHLSCLHLKRSLLRLWDRGLECTEKRSRGAGGEGGRGSCSGRMTSKPCHVKPLTVPSGHQTKTETEVDGTELKAARWHLQLSCLHSNRGQEIAVLTAQRKRVMEVDGERTAVSHCGGRAAGSVYSSSNNSSFCETQRISSRNVYSLACVFVTGRLVSTLAQHTDPKERFVVSGLVIIIIQWPSNLQRRQSDSCKRMCCCSCCWCLGVVYQRFRENQWIGAVLCGRERDQRQNLFFFLVPHQSTSVTAKWNALTQMCLPHTGSVYYRPSTSAPNQPFHINITALGHSTRFVQSLNAFLGMMCSFTH